MLAELSIKNFAIIDDLRIRFSGGLTAITGETGAGKSILIHAVNLLLGSRATSRMIRTGARSAELEALFYIRPDAPFAADLAQGGIDISDSLLIQRTISATDRHRIHINGRLATLDMLSSITEKLASISGQHAHQKLLNEEEHLNILDQYAGTMALREETAGLHRDILGSLAEKKSLETLKKNAQERKQLLVFQKEEITAASIMENEDLELEKEISRLKNALTLQQTAYECEQSLYGAQGAAAEILGQAAKRVASAALLDPDMEQLAQDLESAQYQVEDIAAGLRDYLGHISMDQERLEDREERLYLLASLKRKYGNTLEAVLEYHSGIDSELAKIENREDALKSLDDKLVRASVAIRKKAALLSKNRKKAARAFSKTVAAQLHALGMEDTRFSVEFSSVPAHKDPDHPLNLNDAGIDETGMDRAGFMIAPNVGEKEKPLKEIASGGELSRVVLAVKAILAETDSVETIIFDEVDAGVGGAVADSVGEKLAALSQAQQVVCITHLPQIARFSAHHLTITKQVSKGRAVSRVRTLDENERVDEIARMLSGGNVTETSRKHARELLALNSPLKAG